MLALVLKIAFGLVLIAAIVGGVVLFWIARQDDVPQGRWLGILIMVSAVLVGAYFAFGSSLRHLHLL
jgi:bacteriorhodopsin